MKKTELTTELKGERLVLRVHPITFEHAEKIYEIVNRNREHLAILGFPEYTNCPEDSFTGFLINTVEKGLKNNNCYEYMILKDDEYIGNIGVFSISYEHEKAELGYWLDSKHTGHGYITEAVKILENYLFKIGFNRIEIKAGDINIPSNNVAKRCGYKYEGSIRDYKIFKGEFYNGNIYSKLKNEVN